MKKGFTLIEILGIIILLGVLGLIATVSIEATIKDNKEKAYNLQREFIITSSKIWANQHVFELPENNDEYVIITLGQLKSEGIVRDEIINPRTNKPFDNSLKIKITVDNNSYHYEIVEEN